MEKAMAPYSSTLAWKIPWTEGEGKRDMYEESNMETYNTICKIDHQWTLAVWLRDLKQGLCNNLEGLDGEGDGREVQEGEDICIPMADSG